MYFLGLWFIGYLFSDGILVGGSEEEDRPRFIRLLLIPFWPLFLGFIVGELIKEKLD